MFNCLLNTCNYAVNKNAYLDTYRFNPDMIATDTIWFNYCWLKAEKSLFVVEDMKYFHRVHDESGFMEEVKYNMKKAEEIKELITAL